jgi:hypothetical protein
VVCPPASAKLELIRVPVRSSGSIRVVWHADPARGCTSAGMCGYSGSIEYPTRGGGFLERLREDSRVVDFTGILDPAGSTRVRTERAVAGSAPAVCSQRSRADPFTLQAKHAWGSRVWVSLGTELYPTPLASGQCAGPRIEDVTGSLPAALMKRTHMDRRGARVDLSGRFPWKSGPLSGELISTVRLKSRGAHREKLNGGTNPEKLPGHELYVDLRYRATQLEGELRNDFRAVDAPICRVRDACGTRGSEVYSLEAAGRMVHVIGTARVKSRRRPSLRKALRIVLRRGVFSALAPLGRSSGLTTHAFVRPDGRACTDRFRPRRAPFLLLFSDGERLALSMFAADSTLLRGRCPGPSEAQNGNGQIGRVLLSPSVVRRRVLAAHIRASHAFRGGAFRGTRSARFDVRLRRVHASVKIDPHFDGEEYYVISNGISAHSAP